MLDRGPSRAIASWHGNMQAEVDGRRDGGKAEAPFMIKPLLMSRRN
jgi:hypothetical protein